jgi:hypothetical protein
MENKLIEELNETFENVSLKELRMAYVVCSILKVLYTETFTVFVMLLTGFGLGYGLYATHGNKNIIGISMLVNFTFTIIYLRFFGRDEYATNYNEYKVTKKFLKEKIKQLKARK